MNDHHTYNTREEMQMDLAEPRAPARPHALFRFFDATRLLGFSTSCLFEHHSPGATRALKAWASAHGFAIAERRLTDPDTLVTEVSVPAGPTISVQSTPTLHNQGTP